MKRNIYTYGQRRLVDYGPEGHKELDMTEESYHTHICVCVCVCTYIFE